MKFVAHSRLVTSLAGEYGWYPGARYTNLRDVRGVPRLGFLDIVWENYCFNKHLRAASDTKPVLTVARDVLDKADLPRVMEEVEALAEHADHVVLVPKDPTMVAEMNDLPESLMLGYSVPTKYGGTTIPPAFFRRPVHLLGGRPDVQRRLAEQMPVVSFDCNRFTLDAAFGDFFDG